ncbi:unnamed protein product [Parnassius apollo]|uniref:(apollo) hypothetical protein n=1 Tax=Parnassius apollo TaxID=110799 RepID=A0A8S3XC63_PARAO|nr:unnamed protein product [Parnassius apollo]
MSPSHGADVGYFGNVRNHAKVEVLFHEYSQCGSCWLSIVNMKIAKAESMGKYKRKLDRNLVFNENILEEAKRRTESGQSKRQIYNMDETGLQTVPNKLPKVYAQKEKKVVGKIVSAERDFAPSEVTDRPYPLTESRENEQTSTQAESQMPSVVTETVGTGDSLDLAAQPSNCYLAETANKCCVGSLALGLAAQSLDCDLAETTNEGCVSLSAQPSHCDLAETSKEGCDSSVLLSQFKDAAPINEPIRDITNKSTASPFTSFIKPSDICPLPKLIYKRK